MKPFIYAILALMLSACGGTADKLADQVMEAQTPAERTLRLQGAVTIMSEMFAERASAEPGKARSLLFAVDEVQEAVNDIKPDDLFFNTKIDQAMEPLISALGSALKGRLVQMVKAAVGSRGAQFSLALDALQAGGRVSAMVADLKQAQADVETWKRTQAEVSQILSAVTKKNLAYLRQQARGRR